MSIISTYKQIPINPYLKFILSFILLSGLFYAFNNFFIGITAKGGVYIPFLDEHLNYIRWWRNFTIGSTAKILQWLGYTVITNEYQLKVIGKAGFNIVYSCLGYGLMGIFTAFVITFPEKIKNRFLFLFIGLIIIQALNLLRLVLISLYWKRNANLLGMDHHDLFNLVVYICLILYTIIWIHLNRQEVKSKKK